MTDTEPINYAQQVFHYAPNKPAALIAGVLNLIVTALLLVRLRRRKDRWTLCLPIGTLFLAIGFFFRFALALEPTSFASFLISQILIVVSPAAFLAFNYMVYGRIIRAFADGQSSYSLIRPDRIAKMFIISDVVTFCVQGGAGSLQAHDNTANIGRIILLIGIILQTLSYVLFFVLAVHSQRTFCNDMKFTQNNFPWRLFHVLHFSSVFIMVRATYRVVELAQGNGGYLITHEVTFYTLDTIPLFLATAIYVFFWPGAMIEEYGDRDYLSVQLRSMDSSLP